MSKELNMSNPKKSTQSGSPVDVPRLVRFLDLLEMEISEQRAIADSLEKDGLSDIAERRRERVAGVIFARDYFCEKIPEAQRRGDSADEGGLSQATCYDL